jgi:hypothetical protein
LARVMQIYSRLTSDRPRFQKRSLAFPSIEELGQRLEPEDP